MSDVLYIADLAAKIGRTEAAVRAAIYRGSKDLPRPFKLGGRHAWRTADVDAWLEQRAKKASEARSRRA